MATLTASTPDTSSRAPGGAPSGLPPAGGGQMSPLRALLRDALLNPHTRIYMRTARVVLSLILLSIGLLVLETSEDIQARWEPVFQVLEVVVLAAFTAEYAAHIYATDERRKYIFSWWGLIDLMAILPSYLALFNIQGLLFLRELRVLRVLRMLKLMKLAAERQAESQAKAHEKKAAFGTDIQIYLICFFTVLVISSTLVYHAERGVQDTKFTSILASMWWGVVTVTTTGYGDVIPATPIGKLIASATMLAGLALFSLLTSVVGKVLMASLFGSSSEPAGGQAIDELGIVDTPGPGVGFVQQTGAVVRQTVDSVAGSMSQAVVGDHRLTVRSSGLTRLLHACFVDQDSALYRPIHTFLTTLIFASVALVILESVHTLYDQFTMVFDAIEYLIVAAFTIEYISYLYLARYKLRYMLSFWGVIDLLAILPTFIGLAAYFIPLNLTALKVVRLLRVLRMLRTLKLSKAAVSNARKTLNSKQNTFWLDLQIYLIALFTAVVIMSTLVYYAESDVPDTLFVDVPSAMWWAIVTITTTGYGDMVPATFVGRVIAGCTMVIGLALFGILTSVVGRAMMASLFGDSSAADGEGGQGSPEDAQLIARLQLENDQLRTELALLRTGPGQGS